MSGEWEFQRIERDLASVSEQISNLEVLVPLGSPSAVARTKTLASYPTSASSYFACEPLTILGAETEGSNGVVLGSGVTILALNLGSSVPPLATAVIISYVNHRWVFRYDG